MESKGKFRNERNEEAAENTEDIRRAGSLESIENVAAAEDMRAAGNTGAAEDMRAAGNTGAAEDMRTTGNMAEMGNMTGVESLEDIAVCEEKTGGIKRKRNTADKENMQNERNRGNRGHKKKLTGSFIAKAAAFFLFAGCVVGAVAGGLTTLYLAAEDYYSSDVADVFLDMANNRGAVFYDVCAVRDYIASGDLVQAKEVCSGKNLDIALLKGSLKEDNGSLTDNPALIWTTYEGDYEPALTMDFLMQFPKETLTGNSVVNYEKLYAQTDYIFRVYFNMDFPERDRYAEMYNSCLMLYNMRYVVLWILGISIFLGLNSFLFLMCSAGHRNDMEGIQPSVFSGIPLELYTAVYGTVAFFLLHVMTEFAADAYDNVIWMLAFAVAVAAEALWCTFYLRELAVRMKLGELWTNTIIYRVLWLMKRILRFCWRGFLGMCQGIPLIINTMVIFFGIAIMELVIIVLFGIHYSGVMTLWMLKKLILFPIVVYITLMCKRLLEGSRSIAGGRQEVRVDTACMFGSFKECGENLNNIGQGISRAVAERMRSEHLKTELITNVTHDIKTPLTSIINYANLIAEEPAENEKITEYSEVLVRQSGRLKKLLEDLLEASKATTGNLEVNLQPCEVSVILSQAIGEYQQRMEEKQLELIVTQPEPAINIMADGRHLWRVFDNLLNNICKYAREDSRVYLSVEVTDGKVSIIFRNMSKYALNITPEELQERFVRGDRSRHMEGNGLGLSIAKSLTELQNGHMEIVTDGDLFKVSLQFQVISG